MGRVKEKGSSAIRLRKQHGKDQVLRRMPAARFPTAGNYFKIVAIILPKKPSIYMGELEVTNCDFKIKVASCNLEGRLRPVSQSVIPKKRRWV